MAFVTGMAPGDYPEVSEWGQFNFFPDIWNKIDNPSSPYVQRDWTWSAMNHEWRQQEQPNMTAYLLHFNGGQRAGSSLLVRARPVALTGLDMKISALYYKPVRRD